jgi:hypothetical protein
MRSTFEIKSDVSTLRRALEKKQISEQEYKEAREELRKDYYIAWREENGLPYEVGKTRIRINHIKEHSFENSRLYEVFLEEKGKKGWVILSVNRYNINKHLTRWTDELLWLNITGFKKVWKEKMEKRLEDIKKRGL